MGQQTNEMVYVEVTWFEPGDTPSQKFLSEVPERLWFMVMAGEICPIPQEGATVSTNYLRGSLYFQPLPAQHFPTSPWVSFIDIELDTCGMDEAFGQGYDVEKIGAYAYQHREDDSMFNYFQGFIALYSVYTYTIYRNEGNDSETEYELLGILDMEKLPLALAKETTTP